MATPSYDTDRVLTLPNAISVLRLLGVPLFLWLVLGPRADVAGVAVLAVAGATDWLDGRLARALHVVSRVGQMLDPVADRLYILATIVALALRQIIPWWLVVLLVARDVMLAALVPFLHTRGFTSLPVHFIGKAGTFVLLVAFPVILLGAGAATWQQAAHVVGWALALWGTGLYWWAGLTYVEQTVRLLRSQPRVARRDRPGRRAA